MNYFIKIDDEAQGPFTAEQIKRRLGEKGYQPTDLVRREDAEEWVTLESMEEFREAARDQVPLANPMAWISLAMGLLSLVLLVLLPLLKDPYFLPTCILACLLGHLGLRKISRSPQRVQGYLAARWGQWLGVGVFWVAIVASVFIPGRHRISEKGNQTKAISNCRQIITAIRIYTSDYNGAYPDLATLKAMTSNDAFRELFTAGVLNNEMIFGCPHSSDGNPDGKIGTPPDYRDALKPGENHWALTTGLTESGDGTIPLVFEAPIEATWPPQWLFRSSESKDFGRTWSKGKIIIGTNDSSVAVLPTVSVGKGLVELAPLPDGQVLFQTDTSEKHEILNVAK